MTKVQEQRITKIVKKVAGDRYYEDTLTEEQCEEICELCPYSNKCGKEELYYGCYVWEEAMGEDL